MSVQGERLGAAGVGELGCRLPDILYTSKRCIARCCCWCVLLLLLLLVLLHGEWHNLLKAQGGNAAAVHGRKQEPPFCSVRGW